MPFRNLALLDKIDFFTCSHSFVRSNPHDKLFVPYHSLGVGFPYQILTDTSQMLIPHMRQGRRKNPPT